jgi:hypothetical protein
MAKAVKILGGDYEMEDQVGTEDDNMSYTLYRRLGSVGGAIIVRDEDVGKNVIARTFPTFEAAKQAYDENLEIILD